MAWREISFDGNGGTLQSASTLYYYTVDGHWATAQNTGNEYGITRINKPTRPNYIFTGFWTGTGGSGTMCVNEKGILVTPCYFTEDTVIYAGWRPYSKVILANGSDASGGTAEFYHRLDGSAYFADAELTTPIQMITVPTGAGRLVGYYLDGVKLIDENGALTWQLLNSDYRSDVTLTAVWFGGVVDYFNLASSALVAIASESGDTYRIESAAHFGKHESGVKQVGGIWRNPTVTYAVKADTNISAQLGKGFAAQFTGSGSNRRMAVSGYMITSVEIVTEIGKFPTVTVSAVANEGGNAVNNFTVNNGKFNFSVPVVARSKAQNLLEAISGGGRLQRVSLVATCDPVVCEENLMPSASDIVNGRFEISAETVAPNGDAAPTAASGFDLANATRVGQEADFTRYTVEMRKEMT